VASRFTKVLLDIRTIARPLLYQQPAQTA